MKWMKPANHNYSYGFQGQERDDEVAGSGNSYTSNFWQYDSRLGRRWNTDPVVKHHESPYASFANNPVWFADPNGADTTLYSSATGNKIDTKTSDSKKTPIWVVDTEAKNYDPDNPWATATELNYSVGKKQKTNIGAGNLRADHPLAGKGWNYGAQVYEEDLIDMTREFSSIVTRWSSYFQTKGAEWDQAAQNHLECTFCMLFDSDKYGSLLLSKKVDFISMVGPNRPFDLKSRSRGNLQQIPTFAAVVIGQYSFYNGTLMGYDDYGNAAYGAWGRAYGYDLGTLERSADVDQIFHTANSDPGRDQYFVGFGYKVSW